MASTHLEALPPLAPFPPSDVRIQLGSKEWEGLLSIWDTALKAHASLPANEISKAHSLPPFLTSFITQVSQAGPSATLGTSSTARSLYHTSLDLFSRLLVVKSPTELLQWQVLADASKLYTKSRIAGALATCFSTATALETALSTPKKLLMSKLNAGLKTDMAVPEQTLARLNHLLHSSPDAAAYFAAGSDFLDGLISCYKIMNPPLRKVLVATTYLCLVGLTETASPTQNETVGKGKDTSRPPRWGMLTDILYSLLSAAETHKSGPLNANDSLVAELVSATPVLGLILRRAEECSALSSTLKARVDLLQGYKKMGVGATRPKAKRKRATARESKGKGRAEGEDAKTEMHMHKMSQIAVIQDLFPTLGSGFVALLLDEFGDDVETVTARLLEDSLPPHLASADRSRNLYGHSSEFAPVSIEPLIPNTVVRSSLAADAKASSTPHDMAPRSTPPPQALPSRRNVFDDDELTETMSNLHFGKRAEGSADALLADRSEAPNKAAIMSALAAFDSDDDERDDTYDADDVGGAIDTAVGGGEQEMVDGGPNEEALFRAWRADPKVFDRDAATRRGPGRAKMREETGMTDEAIEGWAVMLGRTPKMKRRLEAKYSAFDGEQTELASTAWRAGADQSDAEGGMSSSSNSRGGRGRGRGRGGGGGGRGGGRGGGNVAGPTGEKDTEAARRRKEANKGARANHNRRDQRAKKMARGGLPG